MREVKFRGIGLDGKWVYGYLQGASIICRHENGVEVRIDVITKTLGQYIGVLDKKGVEIYEGTILRHPDGSYHYVKWRADIATYMLYDVFEMSMHLYSKIENNICTTFYEAAGDVYNNYDLLGDDVNLLEVLDHDNYDLEVKILDLLN